MGVHLVSWCRRQRVVPVNGKTYFYPRATVLSRWCGGAQPSGPEKYFIAVSSGSAAQGEMCDKMCSRGLKQI